MEKFKDRSLGIIAIGIDDTETTLAMLAGHGSKFIDAAIDGPFYAQIFDGACGTPALDPDAEWVLVNDTNADSFSIDRAQRGDLAKTHNQLGHTYYLMAGPGADLLNSIITLDTMNTALNLKVDKVAGKDLSTNDYTDIEKTKLAGIETGAQVNTVTSVNSKAGAVVLVKADINLGNVDDTSDLNKPISTATQIALGNKADLVNGLVPSTQLPSYVDDVLEFTTSSAFPVTGETGKIYIAQDTNLTYRWSGTSYVEISKSLALGETSSTAYRGDRGKIAYDHSQLITGNPHGVTKAEVGLAQADNTSDADKPISTATQAALDLKANLADAGGYNADLNNLRLTNALDILSLQANNSLISGQLKNLIRDYFINANGYLNSISPTNTTAAFSSPIYKNSIGIIQKFNQYMYANSGYIYTSPSSDFTLGTNNFTFDFRIYPLTLTSQGLFHLSQDGNNEIRCLINSSQKLYFDIYSGGTCLALYTQNSGNINLNAWNHIAIVRNGSTFYMFINGTMITLTVGTAIGNNSIPAFTGNFNIGYVADGGYRFTGYIDEFRMSNGSARWTANFTPPTAPYATDSYTKLLLHMDGADNSTTFVDECGHTFSVNGSAIIKSSVGDNIIETNTIALPFAPSNYQIFAYRENITGTGSITADVSFDNGTNWQTGVSLDTPVVITNPGTQLIIKINLNAGASAGSAECAGYGILLW